MRKIMLAGAAALALAISPANAEEPYESGRYDATVGVTTSVGPSFGFVPGTCPDLCIGGYSFSAPGLLPTKVVINDASGAPVGVTVAQNFVTDPTDTTSGDPGEPRVDACGGEIDLLTSEVPFDPTRPIAVFIDLLNDACLPGIATSGTIDLYVAF